MPSNPKKTDSDRMSNDSSDKLAVAVMNLIFLIAILALGFYVATFYYKDKLNAQAIIDKSCIYSLNGRYQDGINDGMKQLISQVYIDTQNCKPAYYKVPTDILELNFGVKRLDCNTCNCSA